LEAGRRQAKANRVEHFIQDRHGKIQGRNSYGGDSPRRPG
jgi:hypothetical protein